MKSSLLTGTYFILLVFALLNITLYLHGEKINKLEKILVHTEKVLDKADKTLEKTNKTVKKVQKLAKDAKKLSKDAKELSKEAKKMSKVAESISENDITVKVDPKVLKKIEKVEKTANLLFSDKRMNMLVHNASKEFSEVIQDNAEKAGEAAGKSFGTAASEEIQKSPITVSATVTQEGDEEEPSELTIEDIKDLMNR